MKNFRFTNLDDPDLYLNENARRMLDGYRISFSQAGEQLARQGYADRAQELLTTFADQVPFSTVAGDLQTYMLMARALEISGATDRAQRVMQESEPVVFAELRSRSQRSQAYALQLAGAVRSTYMDVGADSARAAFDQRLEQVLQQQQINLTPNQRQRLGLAQSSPGDASLPPGISTPAPSPSPTETPEPGTQRPPASESSPESSPESSTP